MFRLALPVVVLLLMTACSKKEEVPPPPPPPAPPVAAPAPAPVPEPVIAPAAPADAQSQKAAPPKSTTLVPGVAAAAAGTYTVVKGDTLYRIAKTHGVKVSDLMTWNQIKKADRLRIGQKLRLSGK